VVSGRAQRVRKGVNVYYCAPGDQKTIRALPKGLELVATEQKYNCGRGDPFSSLPPRRLWTLANQEKSPHHILRGKRPLCTGMRVR